MKISELAQATAINAEDVFPVVQGGATKKVPAKILLGDIIGFGCLFNASNKIIFDTTNKTITIPKYSRIVNGKKVITNLGAYTQADAVIDISEVPQGWLVFNTTTLEWSAIPYTTTIFNDGDIPILVYGNYGIGYIGGMSPVKRDIGADLDEGSITTTQLANNAVTTAKIADNTVTLAKRTIAGSLCYLYNSYGNYPSFDTEAKTFTSKKYTTLLTGTRYYMPEGFRENDIVIDLSSIQNGFICFDTVTLTFNVYSSSQQIGIPETSVMVCAYANYGEIVYMHGTYVIDGNLFGIDTSLSIPDGFVNRKMLEPTILHNQLGKCPRYTYTDMSALGHASWSDMCFIGDYLWLFYPSDASGTNSAKIKVVNKEDMSVVHTITHDFGHLNTCDYCKETDTLLVGNLGTSTETKERMFVFYNVSDWLNSTELSFDTVDKTIIDLSAICPGNHKTTACCWGENNFSLNNIIYISFLYDKQFAKIVLGTDTNQLDNGTYTEVADGKFNGTYNVIMQSDYSPMESGDEVVQGATFYNGQMLTANGDNYTARASLWGFDTNGNIQRELFEFPIYNNDGNKSTTYKTYTEGIAVDEDSGYIYQGVFSQQTSGGRFYLIKYKL